MHSTKMNSTKMNSTNSDLDNEIKTAVQKLRRTKCQCCNGTPYLDNFGEWYNGKWWCYDHVDKLFEKEGVSDLHELIDKGGADR